MRDLLSHGEEQIVEFFEKDYGTERIFHIVIVTYTLLIERLQQMDISVPLRSDWRECDTVPLATRDRGGVDAFRDVDGPSPFLFV